MSKSTGNFLTIRDCIEKFGVDATRLTLADSGDSLDDANFETEFANNAILKLFTFEEWIKKNIQENVPMNFDFTESKQNQDLWDNILENAVNQAVKNTTQHYDGMRFKQALQSAFFIPQGIKEDYLIAKNKKSNPYNLMRFIEAQLVMMNPIIPHFT
jgi:leucyl-tRNA synthetase